MMRVFAILLALLPAAASAEFALSDMVGKWAGEGMYYEPLSRAKMRCRLTIVGSDAAIAMSGRCGSSLGAEKVHLDLIRQPDGQIVLRAGKNAPETDSPIEALVGRPTRSQLIVRGQSGQESAVMQFVSNADGTLYFLTKLDGAKGERTSAVTLSRR